jgi:threonine synthase
MAPLIFGCPDCSKAGVTSVLETVCLHSQPPAKPEPGRVGGLLRFADLLPGGGADRVSLGEGGTPLVRSRIIGPRLGLKHLYFKNETVNPTWSFKDRYVSVSVNMARIFGFKRIVVSSTGNLGVSAAAYASAAGMACLFLAPPGISQGIVEQARQYGATVVVTSWDGRQPLLEHLARTGDWYPIALFLPRPVNDPFGVEGYRTFGYEIAGNLGTTPGAVLFPCARGNGLYGAWKGFREAREWGWIDGLPKMVACQPVGADSLAESLRRNAPEPVELPATQSVAFSTMETVGGAHALQAIRDSAGTALSATDDEILAAQRDLGREGLWAEASSALPVACLPGLIRSGLVGEDEPVVCVLTGAGIKWAGMGAEPIPPVEIAPDPAALERYLAANGA